MDPDTKVLFTLEMNPGEQVLSNMLTGRGNLFQKLWAAQELIRVITSSSIIYMSSLPLHHHFSSLIIHLSSPLIVHDHHHHLIRSPSPSHLHQLGSRSSFSKISTALSSKTTSSPFHEELSLLLSDSSSPFSSPLLLQLYREEKDLYTQAIIASRCVHLRGQQAEELALQFIERDKKGEELLYGTLSSSLKLLGNQVILFRFISPSHFFRGIRNTLNSSAVTWTIHALESPPPPSLPSLHTATTQPTTS